MLNQADNRGMELRDVITVASMIEAEAANDEERPVIASVIYNRLNAGMPLQIDATVMYALGEHKEYLTVEDTQVQSPYNTYLNTGLPAGPICNPGLSSINAALNPGQTDYLYYAPRHRERDASLLLELRGVRGLYGHAGLHGRDSERINA